MLHVLEVRDAIRIGDRIIQISRKVQSVRLLGAVQPGITIGNLHVLSR